jgi:hypothetical protein
MRRLEILHGVLVFKNKTILFGQTKEGKLTQIIESNKLNKKHLKHLNSKTKHIDAY